MEINIKTWVLEELESLLNDMSLEDTLLFNSLNKETNGEIYYNDNSAYWSLDVKGKGVIDWDYLKSLFDRDNKDMNDYLFTIHDYLNAYIYENLLSSYNAIMNPYNIETLGRNNGHWSIDINSIRWYIDIDDDVIENAIKNISVEEDDYDYYEEIARWIFENKYSYIKFDVEDFINKFNHFESSLNKDNEYMKSNEFVEKLYNGLID